MPAGPSNTRVVDGQETRPPRRIRKGAAEVLAASAAAIVLTILMTWPLAPGMASVGRTANSGDARFGAWNVMWVAHALTTDPLGVFDANIFSPHRRTLAFSEANLGAGVLAVPVWLITRDSTAAYNSVVLFAFASSFLGMWLLARRLTGDPVAAGAAAVVFAFCPYLFSHTAHIQLLLAAGLPLSLLALHRVVEAPSVGRGLVLGVTIAAQALCCAYYGVFAALAVAWGAVFFACVGRRWASRPYWAAVATGALVSVAIVMPFFAPYLGIQQSTGFVRSLDDARMYSATLRSYLASSASAHAWMLPWIRDWNGIVLFPGFVAVGLGLWPVFRAMRRRGGRPAGHPPGPAAGLGPFYATLGLLAFWASFGPGAGLYTVLHEAIPVFSFLRAPSRLGILVVLALAVGTAFTVRALMRRFGGGWRALGVACGVGVLAVADLAVMPIDWRPVEPIPEAYRVLARVPRGPLVVFPFFSNRSDFHLHTRYMLDSTVHWQPLVNGYSDYIPPDFRELATRLASFPSLESVDAMRERQVRYIAIQGDWYAPEHLAAIRKALGEHAEHFRLLAADDQVQVFEVLGWPR